MKKCFLLFLLECSFVFGIDYKECLPNRMGFNLNDDIKKLKEQELIKILSDKEEYEKYYLVDKNLTLFVINNKIEAVQEKNSPLLKEPAQSDFLLKNGYSFVKEIKGVEIYESVFCTVAINNAEDLVSIIKPIGAEINLPLLKIEKECLPDSYNIFLGEELESIEKKISKMNPVLPTKDYIKNKDSPDAMFLIRIHKIPMLISFKNNRLVAVVELASPLSKEENLKKFIKNKKYHFVNGNKEESIYRMKNCVLMVREGTASFVSIDSSSLGY
ncbi:hypothetical protein B6S12_04980 [Helicobacter valdiviensis]|uniref:Uncharacterized protein n=1 Tax=Helicobacter valdiviensis TaxID=1458358 RepID=A0A2W6NL72_9HELI|nr:hypothetical protein [Helicobacter valdiviensis]PZT48176.1 hypothetical protein B6S12_04980 [Helicobacter valdiviensis]